MSWEEVKARLGKWVEHPTTMIQREGLASDIRAALDHAEDGWARVSVIEAENQRLRQRVEELEREKAKVESHHKAWHREKWGHGPCCTCQKCGQFYDECRCSLDDVAEELEAAETKLARCVEALDRTLTEAGMHAHKHGCPERLRRPARWDEFAPCAGCQAEAALAAAKGGE